MQISPGTQLVWSLSGSEAINLGMSLIEPDHLFCALLKFSELDDDTITRLLNNPSDLPIVVEERDDLSLALEDLEGSTADIRHAVRKEAEHGTHKLEGNLIHRSEASRKLFERAIEKANSQDEPVHPTHLLSVILAEPTPAMKKVLKKEDGIPDWLLEKEGDDKKEEADERLVSWIQPIQQLAPKKGFSVKETCQPQLRIISLALTAASPSPVLLICEPKVEVSAMLGNIAEDESNLLLYKADHAKLLVDLADMDDPNLPGREIARVMDEIQTKENAWLFFDLSSETQVEDSTLTSLTALLPKQPRLVLAIGEKTYQRQILTDQAAEAGFRSIWLHNLDVEKSLNRL